MKERVNVPALRLVAGLCMASGLLSSRVTAAIRIDPVEDIGVGSQSFLVAVINDLHCNTANIDVAVDSINARDSVMFTMVDGDLTNCADPRPDSEFDYVLSHLSRLSKPWIPIPGNHDMVFNYWDEGEQRWREAETVGPAPDYLFETRAYHQKLEPWYLHLDSIQAESIGIDSLVQDPTHYWNYAAADWGGLHGYDIFHNFAFKAGPPGSPYRFLCLDCNTRWHAIETPEIDRLGFGDTLRDINWKYNFGTNPLGEVHDFCFADRASSIRIRPHNALADWSFRICKDSGFGAPDTYYVGSGVCNLDLTPTFNNAVKSIEFLYNVDSVTLYDTTGCTGDVRLDVHSSDRDLYVNGPAQWWQQYIKDYHAQNQAGERDKVIIFNHVPVTVSPGHRIVDDIMGFPADSIIALTPDSALTYPGGVGHSLGRLSGFLDNYRDEIGAWFSGHIDPGFYGVHILGVSIGISVPEATQFKHGSDVICSRWIVPANEAGDGCVKLVRFWYDGQPIVDCDRSGVVPDVVNYTKDDSAAVRAFVINDGVLTIGVYDGAKLLKTMARDVNVSDGDTVVIPWDCRDSLGNLLEPGDYRVKYYGGSSYMGCSPFVIKGTKVHGAVSEVWDTMGSPYVLTGNSSVPTGDTLRVRPGVYVMPLGAHGLTVSGALIANGGFGDSSHICFTPFRRLRPTPDSCAVGAWKGIQVNAGGLCSLDYCSIEYAGGTSDSAAVFCLDSAQLVMINSTISHSSSRGYSADEVRDFNNFIYGDTFECCASYPAALLAESVGAVVNSCTFRNNGTKGLLVHASADHEVGKSANWLKCEASAWRYDIADGDLHVLKSSAGVCTLTVAPGVVMRFEKNAKLLVQHSDDKNGCLVAGNGADSVTFTGMDTVYADSFWGGIECQAYTHTRLNGCNVLHVDGPGIDVTNGTAVVDVLHGTIRRTETGIANNSNYLTVNGCNIVYNEKGIWVSGGEASITGTHFTDNYGYGLYAAGNEYVGVTSCTFSGNYVPVRIRANLVSDLIAQNTFQGNTYRGVEIGSGTYSGRISCGTHTWPANTEVHSYRIRSDVDVYADALVDEVTGRSTGTSGQDTGPGVGALGEARNRSGVMVVVPTLDIGAGATVEFESGKYMKVGSTVNKRGTLRARGYANAKVTFCCFEVGHWGGLWLNDGSDASELRQCVLEDGGGSNTTEHAAIYCSNSIPSISWCLISGANGDNDSRGMYASGCTPSPSHCVFSGCTRGIEYNVSTGTPSFSSCEFTGCHDAVYIASNHAPVNANTNNFIGNTYAAVNNLNSQADSANALYCYWNNSTAPYGPNGGDAAYGKVRWQPAVGESIVVDPLLDIAAWRPITPPPLGKDTIVCDGDTWLSVTGRVKNYYPDELPNVPFRMTIDSIYDRTVTQKVYPTTESMFVSFPNCTLSAGLHVVRMTALLEGDENHSNDTVYDTLLIRHSIDAAALHVVQPGSSITVDDSITPTALIANYSDSTRTVPVKFYFDSFLRDSIGVSVGPHESAQAVFNKRTFPPGNRLVQFVCSLPIDDNRHNDTASAMVTVDAGDYWVAQDSPPYTNARLCWDKGEYLYAAQRTGSGVSRFSTMVDDWSAVSSPPVETVFGITSLRGQVYALGRATGSLTDGRQDAKWKGEMANDGSGSTNRQDRQVRQGQLGQVRNQNADTRNQNEAQTGVTQDANREKHGGAFSNALGIYRYVADGDSWVLVTTCDTTLVPGSGSNLVADDAGSIYLIEGGTTRVRRYIVAADSWVSITASYAISRWGAAAWGRGILYVLADSTRVLKLNPGNGQWTTINLDQADVSYGTALCADPVMDRLFAFCHRPPWNPFPTSPFRERDLRQQPPQWLPKATGVTDATGAALCFGSTQAYCLDGHGGFWRYRPEPQADIAAVGFAMPDTIPCDSSVSDVGIVQNGLQDTLQFYVRLAFGGIHPPTASVRVAPQQWDTVAFDSTTLSPGTYPCTLTVWRTLGPDDQFNDTAFRTLFVRYLKDAQALAVESPVGRIPYVNQIHPQGRVKNNSDETLSVWVRMTIGTGYADSSLVTLPPLAEDTVTFDTCHLRLGDYQVALRVRCTGDEVPGNDEASDSVQIVDGDYWKVLARCPDYEVRLVGSPGSDVYSAKRTGTNFRHYNAAQDTWESKAASSMTTNLSLCRFGTKIYDLGSFAYLDAGSSVGLGPRTGRAQTGLAGVIGMSNGGGGQTDGPSAITRYDVSNNTWNTVVSPLPFTVGNGSCLFATDDTTLFVLSLGSTNNLRRYNITRHTWAQKTSMPGSVSAWASGAYDNAGHFYVLTDPTGKLRKYSVAGDSWVSLTPLNRTTPSGTALCCDPAKNVLYALWAGSSPNAYCYDITGNAWTAVEPFPSSLSQPALAQCGDNPYGQDSLTFAKYVPEPELDVAATAILVPGDTERYDSAVVPTGVVHNLSEAPVWYQATFNVGDMTQVQPSLYLEADQTDTVTFTSTYLPAGHVTATLYVTCTGDVNHGNDTCFKSVQVEAPWEPRTQSSYAQGRLDADTGASVYLGARSAPVVQKYVVSGNNWNGVKSPPFLGGCIDLAYYNGALYALGLVGSDGAPEGRRLGSEAGPDLTTHPAIYRHALSDTTWTRVTDSLPVSTLGTCPWIVATGSGVYLEPGYGRAFFRRDSSQGWTLRDSLPVSVTSPVAMDWDRNDAIFLLAAMSGTTSAFLRYSLSGDSWIELKPVPVQPQAGLSLAAEPNGNLVLALLPADTGHALLYGYNRSQDTWTLQPSPTWSIADGAAMTWAGAQAFALTGTITTQPSWFWCYDPGFAAYWGQGLEGVAGSPMPLFRWQLTCAPNPVSARAAIRWQVPRQSSVSLKVYNTAGQMVRVLRQGTVKPGSYTTTWNGCDQQGRRLAAGVYVCTLDGPGTRITKKVVLTQ